MSQDIFQVEWNGKTQGMTARMVNALTYAMENIGWHPILPGARVAVDRLVARGLVEVDEKCKSGAHYQLKMVSVSPLEVA